MPYAPSVASRLLAALCCGTLSRPIATIHYTLLLLLRPTSSIRLLVLDFPPQLVKDLRPRSKVGLKTIDLFADGLEIISDAAEATTASRLISGGPFLELAELLALIIEELLELALDEGGAGIALSAAAPAGVNASTAMPSIRH